MEERNDGIYNDYGGRVTNFNVTKVCALCLPDRPEEIVAIEAEVSVAGRSRTIILNIEGGFAAQIRKNFPLSRTMGAFDVGAFDSYLIERACARNDKKILIQNIGIMKSPLGEWIFADSHLTTECDGFFVALAPNVESISLAQNADTISSNSITRIIRDMAKHPNTVLPAFCYTLLCSLRTQIEKLELATFPILYVVGCQNFGKTTLVTRYCLIYNDKNGKVFGKYDAKSSVIGLIKEFSRLSNQVVLVDDLLKSSVSSITKERLKVIADITHFAANDNDRCTARSESTCKVGIACTAETPLTAASDLSRIIQIEINEAIIGTLEATRADAATTFYLWIKWLLPHFDEAISNLKMKLNEITGSETARFQVSWLLLSWVNELFFRYALEKEIVSEKYYKSAVQRGNKIFEDILRKQVSSVRRLQNNPSRGNFSWYIWDGHQRGIFSIVDKRKKMSASDCIIENNALCIRTETLLKFFHAQEGFSSLSAKGLTRALRQEGVLDFPLEGESTTRQNRERRSSSKKIAGKRYLELNLTKLKRSAHAH